MRGTKAEAKQRRARKGEREKKKKRQRSKNSRKLNSSTAPLKRRSGQAPVGLGGRRGGGEVRRVEEGGGRGFCLKTTRSNLQQDADASRNCTWGGVRWGRGCHSRGAKSKQPGQDPAGSGREGTQEGKQPATDTHRA